MLDTCRDVTNRNKAHNWLAPEVSNEIVGADLTRPWLLATEGAVALAPLALWNESFLVVACYAPGDFSTSKIFRLAYLGDESSSVASRNEESFESMRVEEVGYMTTRDVTDVSVFYDPWTGDALILLSSRGATPTLLYRWQKASRSGIALPHTKLVQSINTSEAVRISSTSAFQGTIYVTIAQREPASTSSVLRWNGTHLLGILNLTDLPKDAAGGQVLASSGGRALATWEKNGAKWLLVGNSFNSSAARETGPGQCYMGHGTDWISCGVNTDKTTTDETKWGTPIFCYGSGQGECLRGMSGVQPSASRPGGFLSRTEVFSSLYRVVEEPRLDMKRPSALVISPDGRMVYVAAYGSQSISCFIRQLPSGELGFRPEASYAINLDDPLNSPSFAAAWPSTEEQPPLRRPLDGLSGLAINSDGTMLVATAAYDSLDRRSGGGALYVFERSVEFGNLTLVQTFRDGDRTPDGRPLDCLGGASAVAVADRWVYVASSKDHCLSAFEIVTVNASSSSNASSIGSVTSVQRVQYLDRLREGELLLDQFETDAVLNASHDSWRNESTPRRLGGGRHPWANRSRASVSFRIDGVLYLAVAASIGDADGRGTLGVFKLREESLSFELHQTFPRDHNPSDVEFVQLPSLAPDGEEKHLLVVSNLGRGTAPPASPSATPINVYLFNRASGNFVLFQSLSVELLDGLQVPPFLSQSASLKSCPPGPLRRPRPSPSAEWACNAPRNNSNATTPPSVGVNNSNATTPPRNNSNATTPPTPPTVVPNDYESDFLSVPQYACIPEGLVQSIRVWSEGATAFVAAAYIWDQPSDVSYKWYSVVWKWNANGFSTTETGDRVDGIGFQVFQLIPTSAATDVEILRLPSATLLVFANLLHKTLPDDYRAVSVVYRYNPQAYNPIFRSAAGYFELIDMLPTVGAIALKGMTVPSTYAVGKGGVVYEDDLYLLGVVSMQARQLAHSSYYISASSCYYMCPHATICVLMLLFLSAYCYVSACYLCVRILLMCPHAHAGEPRARAVSSFAHLPVGRGAREDGVASSDGAVDRHRFQDRIGHGAAAPRPRSFPNPHRL
jgi:hypothetical protein